MHDSDRELPRDVLFRRRAARPAPVWVGAIVENAAPSFFMIDPRTGRSFLAQSIEPQKT